MKLIRFLLLKDLPGTPAGKIFEFAEHDCWVNQTPIATLTLSKCRQFPEWFEEIKDKPPEKPMWIILGGKYHND